MGAQAWRYPVRAWCRRRWVRWPVASTHLSFVPGQNVLQLRRVCRWLRTLPAPHLLLGDLNMPPALAGRLSGLEVLARGATYATPAPRVQLDHILGRGAATTAARASALALPVSDHRALSVELSGSVPGTRADIDDPL